MQLVHELIRFFFSIERHTQKNHLNWFERKVKEKSDNCLVVMKVNWISSRVLKEQKRNIEYQGLFFHCTCDKYEFLGKNGSGLFRQFLTATWLPVQEWLQWLYVISQVENSENSQTDQISTKSCRFYTLKRLTKAISPPSQSPQFSPRPCVEPFPSTWNKTFPSAQIFVLAFSVCWVVRPWRELRNSKHRHIKP